MAARSNNIFEFMDAVKSGTLARNAEVDSIYNRTAVLLCLFAIADLRHDFGIELDITIGTGQNANTIAYYLCYFICGAYYDIAPDPSPHAQLVKTVFQAFNENMSSDGTAKAFMKTTLLNYYYQVISPNRQYFSPTAYLNTFEESMLNTVHYDDKAKLQSALNIITNDNIENTFVSIDAQLGNPLSRLFSLDKMKASIIYNYSSALDAASKPISEMHTYLNVYVQNTDPKLTPFVIKPVYAIFGAEVQITNFEYKDSAWETTIQITFPGVEPIVKTFSHLKKASVDNLGLVQVRGDAKIEDIRAAIDALPAAKKTNIYAVIANHIIKSFGDRLQSLPLTLPQSGQILYRPNGNLKKNGFVAAQATMPITGYHNIEFTNDFLKAMLNYFLQVNTVYTGARSITYSQYQGIGQKTREYVVNHFKTNKGDIHSLLIGLPNNYKVNISSSSTILDTLYDACLARNTIRFCQAHELLQLFIGAAVPSDAVIEAAITEGNYESFFGLTVPVRSLENKLFAMNVPHEIDRSFWTDQYNHIKSQLGVLNSQIINTYLGVKEIDLYASYVQITTSLNTFISNIGIESNSFALTHMIVYGLGLKGINNKFFDIDGAFWRNIITLRRGTIAYNSLAEAKKTIAISDADFTYIIENIFNIIGVRIGEAFAADPVTPQTIEATFSGVNQIIQNSGNATAVLLYNYYYTLFVNMSLTVRAISKMTDISVLQAFLTDEELQYESVKVVERSARASFASTRTKSVSSKKVNKFSRSKLKLKSVVQNISRKTGAKVSASTISAAITTFLPAAAGADEKSIPEAIRESARKAVINPDAKVSWYEQKGISKITGVLLQFVPIHRLKDLGNLIVSKLTGMRGGASKSRSQSRSKRRADLEELCILKLTYMNCTIGQRDNQYAANTLFDAQELLERLVIDYDNLKKSHRKPVIVQSSSYMKFKPTTDVKLATIFENDEEIEQDGGGTETVTMAPQKTVVKRQTIRLSGSDQHTSVSKTVISVATESGKPLSVSKKSSPSVKVEVISRRAARKLLEQRLLAFFWLGFRRNFEQIEFESKVFGRVLPTFATSYLGDVHNQIFWQPLGMYSDLSSEALGRRFESMVLPRFEKEVTSPRRSAITRRAKSAIRNNYNVMRRRSTVKLP